MVQAANISQPFSPEHRLVSRGWRARTSRVVITPGPNDPGSTWQRNREARIEATCRRMSQLLRDIAYRLARRLPSHVDVDDLVGAGAIGLVSAVRQHLDKPEVELERLAARRIRGAIMDHLRASDHLTRRQRAAVIAMQRAKASLEREDRRADLPAVAARLGVSQRRATQIHDRLLSVQIGSLEGVEPPSSSPTPVDELLAKEQRSRLTAAIAALPERLQALVALCYYEDMSYREVSETLGISRSRVCQLHALAMQALQRSLADAA